MSTVRKPNALEEDWLVRFTDWMPGDDLAEFNLPCDGCLLAKAPACPGLDAHCAHGEHCTAVEASCAAAVTTDPCFTCCHCGTPYPREDRP